MRAKVEEEPGLDIVEVTEVDLLQSVFRDILTEVTPAGEIAGSDFMWNIRGSPT